MAKQTRYTIIGRYDDSGEIVINYIEVDGEDIHYEVLRHWGQFKGDGNHYEVIAVFPGELTPAATPETLKKYVDVHFGT